MPSRSFSRSLPVAVAACLASLVFAGCESVKQYNPFESQGTQVDAVSDATDASGKEKTGAPSDPMPEYKGVKHAIGVVDFDNRSNWYGWRQYDMDRNFPLMFESALFDTGRFVLVERENLDAVVLEQDMAQSGRMAAATNVAQTGKIRQARYLATGEIISVTGDQSGQEGGISLRGIRVGGGQSNAAITVIVKLIDTTTGSIVAKENVTGKAGSSKLRVGFSKFGVGGNLGTFAKTPMAEAVQDCLDQAARFIAGNMEELPNAGAVVAEINGQVVINRGGEHAVKTGATYRMIEPGEQVLDPTTGQVLGTTEGAELGELRVVRTDDKMSYCEVVGGGPLPAVGTVVRMN